MSIVSEKILISVGSQQVSYYKSLGYDNVKFRNKLLVNVYDLPVRSMVDIIVRCDSTNCNNERTVRYQDYNKSLEKYGDYYCSSCKSTRIKETCLEKYGVSNVFHLDEVKSKRLSTFISKYDVTHPMKNADVKLSMMKTHVDNFGCHYSSTNESRNKMRNFIIDRYGVGNNFLNIDSMLSRYDVEHPSKSIYIMKRRDEINLVKYDNVCSLHGLEQKELVKRTCLERYDAETPFKSVLVQDKIRNYFIDNYGVDNPSKVPHIHSKKMKTSLRIDNYGSVSYQGSYEKDFLDLYLGILDITDGHSINYNYDGSDRIYHSDFYLPKYNLIVEIKSSYFYELELSKNLVKKQACLDNGYDFIFVIDKDYSELSKIIS